MENYRNLCLRCIKKHFIEKSIYIRTKVDGDHRIQLQYCSPSPTISKNSLNLQGIVSSIHCRDKNNFRLGAKHLNRLFFFPNGFGYIHCKYHLHCCIINSTLYYWCTRTFNSQQMQQIRFWSKPIVNIPCNKYQKVQRTASDVACCIHNAIWEQSSLWSEITCFLAKSHTLTCPFICPVMHQVSLVQPKKLFEFITKPSWKVQGPYFFSH